MVKTNLDTGMENFDREPIQAPQTDRRVDSNRADTRHRIDAIVRTNAPTAAPAATPAAPPAATPAAPPAATPAQPQVPASPAPRELTADDKAPTDARDKPFKYARNTVIGGAAAMTALGSGISQIPLIGQIPYLPQAAAWLQSGLTSLTAPLGLGTGVNATNAFMASLPTALGPASAVALGIPTALWLGGLGKSLITGEKYGGYWGNVAEATKTIAEIPFMPYHYAMKARVKTGEILNGTFNTVKKPFVGAWNLAGNIAKGAWNTATATTSAALTPTKWGIGGAFLGTTLALSTGAGAAIPILAAAGYGISNYLKNTGAMNGSATSSSAGHGH